MGKTLWINFSWCFSLLQYNWDLYSLVFPFYVFSTVLYLSVSQQVYDGDNIHFPLAGTFCGNSIPAYFVSAGNFLTVRFVSDSIVQRGGFNATYRSVPCKTSLPLLHCTSETSKDCFLIIPSYIFYKICTPSQSGVLNYMVTLKRENKI